MSDRIPRLRMFAGPNGSGKTTVKNALGKPPDWFGIYINPDELEQTIRETGFLDLVPFGWTTTTEAVRDFFLASKFLQDQAITEGLAGITVREGSIDFAGLAFNSYHASVLADFLRRKALDEVRSFTFETVMSARDKVDLLREAQSRGFRTYLYYIATEDPEINIQRVHNRVLDGGHDVPEIKIRARYIRSLSLLAEAIPYTNRAYFFDTSEEKAWYFAEATEGTRLDLKSDEMPHWFEPIWERFDTDTPSPP
jgi:predicted ABC-type ATPase